MKRTIFPTLAGLILCLFPLDASSTIMRQLSIKELTQKADLVIIGRVVSIKSQWSSDNTTIYTHVGIQPTSFIKGIPSQKVIEVWVLGGTIGRRTLIALGAPRFIKNEEILVFLRLMPNNPNALTVFGLSQGKFLIGETEVDSTRSVRRDMFGIEFVGPKVKEFPNLNNS